MTFREKLDQLLLDAYKEVAGIHYNEGAVDSPEQEAKEWLLTNGQNFKRAIIQAILDELPEKKSVKERLKYHRDIGLEVDIESANSYNQAIDELRQRLTK